MERTGIQNLIEQKIEELGGLDPNNSLLKLYGSVPGQFNIESIYNWCCRYDKLKGICVDPDEVLKKYCLMLSSAIRHVQAYQDMAKLEIELIQEHNELLKDVNMRGVKYLEMRMKERTPGMITDDYEDFEDEYDTDSLVWYALEDEAECNEDLIKIREIPRISGYSENLDDF